ncbi:28S ribosomal protein S31, mitochondrial [Hyalella azteca]|uniref:Small ribosomal subunit protein mS31 n=1 Tax=Hyalella azteca TaxID=294128 RepID=A0A8B7PHB2_HYAAZ|nr:28S ribosomal protein S31, mitochondrial [Hyalella azteca]
MLRNINLFRRRCPLCQVQHLECSSNRNGDSLPDATTTKSKDSNTSGGQDHEKVCPESPKTEKKIATKNEVQAKLANLLSNFTVELQPAARSSSNLKLASDELRQLRVRAPLTKPQQKLKEEFEAVGPKMAEAIRSVAEKVGGEETESELLDSLKRVTAKPSPPSPEAVLGLRSVLSGLSVEKRVSRHTRTKRFNESLATTDLHSAEPLKIFSPADMSQEPETAAPLLPTWEAQVARELKLCIARPPDSHFQELMQWTEQGKIWQFPVNNEFGMEAEEGRTGFQDHIFLERHLSPWCPKKGPIAHFMELVCVGLSMNPYVSAQRKKETILWYRDYFASKEKLLTEIGAIPADHSMSKEANA